DNYMLFLLSEDERVYILNNKVLHEVVEFNKPINNLEEKNGLFLFTISNTESFIIKNGHESNFYDLNRISKEVDVKYENCYIICAKILETGWQNIKLFLVVIYKDEYNEVTSVTYDIYINNNEIKEVNYSINDFFFESYNLEKNFVRCVYITEWKFLFCFSSESCEVTIFTHNSSMKENSKSNALQLLCIKEGYKLNTRDSDFFFLSLFIYSKYVDNIYRKSKIGKIPPLKNPTVLFLLQENKKIVVEYLDKYKLDDTSSYGTTVTNSNIDNDYDLKEISILQSLGHDVIEIYTNPLGYIDTIFKAFKTKQCIINNNLCSTPIDVTNELKTEPFITKIEEINSKELFQNKLTHTGYIPPKQINIFSTSLNQEVENDSKHTQLPFLFKQPHGKLYPVQPAPIQPTVFQPTVFQPTAVQPTAVQPTPIQPTPIQPTPVQPTPVQPTPVQPTPVQPTPVQPTPVQPTPVQPTPVQPTPVQPTPVQPTPVQPTPVQSSVSKLNESFLSNNKLINIMSTDINKKSVLFEDKNEKPQNIIPSNINTHISIPNKVKTSNLKSNDNTYKLKEKQKTSMVGSYIRPTDLYEDKNIIVKTLPNKYNKLISKGMFNFEKILKSENIQSVTTTKVSKFCTQKKKCYYDKKSKKIVFLDDQGKDGYSYDSYDIYDKYNGIKNDRNKNNEDTEKERNKKKNSEFYNYFNCEDVSFYKQKKLSNKQCEKIIDKIKNKQKFLFNIKTIFVNEKVISAEGEPAKQNVNENNSCNVNNNKNNEQISLGVRKGKNMLASSYTERSITDPTTVEILYNNNIHTYISNEQLDTFYKKLNEHLNKNKLIKIDFKNLYDILKNKNNKNNILNIILYNIYLNSSLIHCEAFIYFILSNMHFHYFINSFFLLEHYFINLIMPYILLTNTDVIKQLNTTMQYDLFCKKKLVTINNGKQANNKNGTTIGHNKLRYNYEDSISGYSSSSSSSGSSSGYSSSYSSSSGYSSSYSSGSSGSSSNISRSNSSSDNMSSYFDYEFNIYDNKEENKKTKSKNETLSTLIPVLDKKTKRKNTDLSNFVPIFDKKTNEKEQLNTVNILNTSINFLNYNLCHALSQKSLPIILDSNINKIENDLNFIKNYVFNVFLKQQNLKKKKNKIK
ncbi:conserved protein, unknown function, partial [Hepatocystis sp. ex Piliocolobus tephrosceles]